MLQSAEMAPLTMIQNVNIGIVCVLTDTEGQEIVCNYEVMLCY